MESENQSFDEWAIVDLFGHTRLAGKVKQQAVGGCSFVRVDVPYTKAAKGFTRLVGEKAIYSITITDETTARLIAEYCTPVPMDTWSVKDMIERKALGQGEPQADLQM
jgi:hypothetical protein